MFYQLENHNHVLFYDKGTVINSSDCEPELWTKNPEEIMIQIMIDIAVSFNDGSRVRNDYDETYISINEIYFHEDDNVIVENNSRKIDVFIIIKYLYIAFVICGSLLILWDKISGIS